MTKNVNLKIRDSFYNLDLHGVIHVTRNGDYSGAIEFNGGFGPPDVARVESACEEAARYLGGPARLTYAERVRIREGVWNLFGMDDPALIERSALGDWKRFQEQYPFEPLSDSFIRSHTVPCPDCEGEPGDDDCEECEGVGGIVYRACWCNASEVIVAEINNAHVMVCLYPDVAIKGYWMNIRVMTEPYYQDPETLRGPRAVFEMSSSKWTGGQAGSAIPRMPDSLRGLVYRASTDELGDAYVLPVDPIEYALEMAGRKISETFWDKV